MPFHFKQVLYELADRLFQTIGAHLRPQNRQATQRGAPGGVPGPDRGQLEEAQGEHRAGLQDQGGRGRDREHPGCPAGGGARRASLDETEH